ncbi:Histone-lysine N-methyltransferase MECOM [Labeo rohita]|uniref:Histone-lysine N-methyltransferase MECOM n=1 Tax=Labeo rohita TaxID=84645 RepID=A0ABQ8L1E2_LABRO|nr:Histone-lysine N-methyltransferase MECOM [Labeo rohita]
MKEQLQKNTKNTTLHYDTVATTDKPSYTNTECVSTTNTQTPAATQASPTQPPKPDPDVLLLMDSNGKFLDPKKESRFIISTLLPRHDTPPHIIYNINAELSRGCSVLPNVHLAHHHHIGPQHLYDGLHLHKDGVRIFAKSLKDAALGCSSASPRHLLPTPRYHQPIHPYMPRNPPPAPVRKDIAWTNTTQRPLHPPTAPYTPVNLQSPTSHPPTGHQTPRKKEETKNHPTPRESPTAESTELC